MASGGDAKVTLKLELDDSQLRSQLNGVVSSLNTMSASRNVTVTVNADTSSARTAINQVQSDVDGLSGGTVDIQADISDVQTDVNTAQNAIDGMHGGTVEIQADISDVQTDVATVESEMDALNGRTSTAHVDADTSSASSAIDDIESRLNALDGRTATVNVNGDGAGGDGGSGGSGGSGSTGGLNISNPFDIGGLASGIINKGAEYEYSSAKARTLAPGVDAAAHDARMMELSQQYGQSASSYNEATYSMLSAGQSYEDTTRQGGILDTASQLAMGGFTTVDAAAGMLAKMGNAYGSTDYAHMANSAITAQNYGITDVAKLASAMPNVNSAAAGAGVSADQALSAMAAITKQGVETNVAATQSKSLYNELNKGGTTGQKTLASIYGDQLDANGNKFGKDVKLSDLMANGMTLGDISRDFAAYGQANGLSLVDMFSSQEAGSAVKNLLGEDGGATFDAALSDMTAEVDAVGPAFQTMSETTTTAMAQMTAEIDASMISLFNGLQPSIEKFTSLLTSEDFQTTLNSVISTLTDFLGSDSFSAFVDALVQAAEWLTNLFGTGNNGDGSGTGDGTGAGGGGIADFGVGLLGLVGGTAMNLGGGLLSLLFGGGGGVGTGAGADGEGGLGGLGGSTRGDVVPSDHATNGVGGGRNRGDGDTAGAGDGGDVSGAADAAASAMDEAASAASTISDAASGISEPISSASGAFTEMSSAAVTISSSTSELSGSMSEASGSASEAASGASTAASAASKAASGASKLSSSLTKAGSSVTKAQSSATTLGSKLSSLASAVSSAISRCNSVGSGADSNNAVGLDLVPRDGYHAILHKGEMVLTAAEASTYRMSAYATGGGSGGSAVDYNQLAQAMSGLSVAMDGRTVGRLTERGVSEAQGARLSRTRRR